MSYPCVECGLCCRRVGAVVKNAREEVKKHNGKVSSLIRDLAKFPYETDEQGVCSKLVDNKCSVYDKRPDVCSVDRSWKLYSKETKEDYYKQNAEICNLLIKEAGLPLKVEL